MASGRALPFYVPRGEGGANKTSVYHTVFPIPSGEGNEHGDESLVDHVLHGFGHSRPNRRRAFAYLYVLDIRRMGYAKRNIGSLMQHQALVGCQF